MAKLTLTEIVSGFGSKQALNGNFDDIEAAIENTLSRDGTTPNTMEADLDMNGNEIINASVVDAEMFKVSGNEIVPSNLGIAPTLQTWTPVLTNGSDDVAVTETIGNYVKLGPLVFITGSVQFTEVQILASDVLLTDTALIGGLPNTLDTSQGISNTPMSVYGVSINDVWAGSVFDSSGTPYVIMQKSDPSSSFLDFQDWGDEGSGVVSFSGLYMTDE